MRVGRTQYNGGSLRVESKSILYTREKLNTNTENNAWT